MATTYDPKQDPGAFSNSTDVEIFGHKSRNITPSDSADLSPYAKAIVVTAAGNLSILPAGNTTDAAAGYVVFSNAPVGFIPPYRVRRVNATGTTATCSTIDNA